MARRRYFGNIRELPSGRYQASYKGPDGARHTAPQTFDSPQYADAWLSRVRTDIQRGDWEPLTSKSIEAKLEADRTQVFGEYAGGGWLAGTCPGVPASCTG